MTTWFWEGFIPSNIFQEIIYISMPFFRVFFFTTAITATAFTTGLRILRVRNQILRIMIKKIFISATFNTEFYSTKYLLVSVFSPTEHIILFTYNLHYPSCLKIIVGDNKYLKGQKKIINSTNKTEEKYLLTTMRTFLALIIIIKFAI